jgi:putative restriction endonuclease
VTDVSLNDARARQALDQLSSLRQHQRDGRRSPHKPLLVLLALGRLAANGTSALTWTEAEDQLAALLEEFGPTSTAGRAQSAAYPFTRLRADAVWTLDQDVPMDNVGPLRHGVTGRLEASLEKALKDQPEQRQRSRVWPAAVIEAWDRQCAFCGFDGAAGGAVVGIEAAHVRWFKLGGPDELDNGLALCSLHHKLFDRGMLGLDEDLTVVVSQRFSARTPNGRSIYDLHGHRLQPRRGTALPAERHVAWHREQVFQGLALVG